MRSILRTLLSARGDARFLLVAILTLAVGIGASAALFTVIDAVLIRPLPYPDSGRLVAVQHTAPGLHLDEFGHSEATYLLYRKHNHVLSGLGAYLDVAASLTGDIETGAEPERVGMARVTGSLGTVLAVPAALGRTLIEADGLPGAEPVAVLADGLWRRRFGADPDVLGRTLKVDGVTHRVVGVMPASYHFPSVKDDLWLPLRIDPAKPDLGNFQLRAVGRLHPGIAPERARRELSDLVRRIPEEYGGDEFSPTFLTNAGLAVLVHPLRDTLVRDVERRLWVIAGGVGIILLIACANVANLFLVRAEGRQREVAVRTAIGASRWAIARTFLAESLTLATLGGALGLGLAAAGVRLLVALKPEDLPRLEEVGINFSVVAFAVLLALLSGLVFGAVGALRYGAPALVPTLKDGGHGTAGRARNRGRTLLVVAQVVMALVLLIGSGLMVKSFWRLREVDPGLDPKGVLTVHLSLPPVRYDSPAAIARFVQQLLERVRALPGVTAAGTVSALPLSRTLTNSGFAVEDFPQPEDATPPLLGNRYASPGYFEAMGIPVREGRTFDRLDPDRQSSEVVVSEAMAHRFWPGKSAVGKRIAPGSGGPGKWMTIIGVVGSVHDESLETAPTPSVYFALRRLPRDDSAETVPDSFYLVVRGAGEPLALARPVHDAIRALDPNLPVADVRTMDELVAASTARTSFTMLLLVIAASVALLLGTVGIYGVISYVVRQRTREIGVRMALGARRADIARMVLAQGLAIVVAGIVLGLAAAFALTRLMVALLFEVSPTDPTIFAAVPTFLAAVALLASYLPAQRAAAVEPLEAIRSE